MAASELGSAPSLKPVSGSVEDAEEAAVVLGDIGSLTGVHPDNGRADQFRWPLADVFAFLVEDLYPVVLTIGYQYLSVRSRRNTPCGRLNCPAPLPGSPQLLMCSPSAVNLWTRQLA